MDNFKYTILVRTQTKPIPTLNLGNVRDVRGFILAHFPMKKYQESVTCAPDQYTVSICIDGQLLGVGRSDALTVAERKARIKVAKNMYQTLCAGSTPAGARSMHSK